MDAIVIENEKYFLKIDKCAIKYDKYFKQENRITY